MQRRASHGGESRWTSSRRREQLTSLPDTPQYPHEPGLRCALVAKLDGRVLEVAIEGTLRSCPFTQLRVGIAVQTDN
eukprot:1569481-Lingulodinium_polyedra.AAC.1